MRIHFMGGADTVTGSQHIIEANGGLVLRDCGMYQGRRDEANRINSDLGFEASHINNVLLSHAHIDHCGNLPKLVAKGYAGPIHATSATVSLTDIMLKDAARIQEQDAEYLNQKSNRKDLPPVVPLYTTADALIAIDRLKGHEYGHTFELAPGIEHRSREAGHILGAALSEFTVKEPGKTTRVGFAVDLGRKNLPLIRDPELLENIDVLVMESTYGDREHDDATHAEEQLGRAMSRAFERGGKVLIPSFALERAQEILFHIQNLVSKGRIPQRPVYVDSPMASAITRVFDDKLKYLDEEFHKLKNASGCLMCPPWVRFISSVEESKKVSTSDESCVVIAASGMCEHGRILHHLKHGVGSPRNLIAIVGYQASYTLGRRLVEGAEEVRIFGDIFQRRAEVEVLPAFSAHAGRTELIDYAKQVKPKSIYLVHGEQDQREALAEGLLTAGFARVHLPKRGDVAEL